MLLLILALCASFVPLLAQDNCAQFDDCSGHGACTSDGWFCDCLTGWRGLRCILPPTAITEKDWIPGLVESGTVQYYRIEKDNLRAGWYVTVEPTEGQQVALLLGIGRPMAPQDPDLEPEWADVRADERVKEVKIPNTTPLATAYPGDTDLYITIVGPSQSGQVARYRLKYWDLVPSLGIFPGMSALASWGIVIGLICCCYYMCCFAAYAYVVYTKKNKKSKLGEFQMQMMGGTDASARGGPYPNEMMGTTATGGWGTEGSQLMVGGQQPQQQQWGQSVDPNAQWGAQPQMGGSMMSVSSGMSMNSNAQWGAQPAMGGGGGSMQAGYSGNVGGYGAEQAAFQQQQGYANQPAW